MMKDLSLEKLLHAEFPEIVQTELRRDILEKSQYFEAREGEIILNFRESIKAVPLVLSGSLKVLRNDDTGREILLYYVRPGECCAMTLSSSLKRESSLVRAIAQTDVTGLLLPVRAVLDFRVLYPGWNDFVVQAFAQRFDEIIELVDELSFHHVDHRLLKYLREKSQLLETETLPISHMEIASEINTSREVVSRLLKKMEKEGLLKLARERIVLKLDVN
ncbi:MAG: Crp/Fnr family transcriptional regulator [Saprospiraceae bacterium]|nr:Crp/Fnr family transcriptional regulator [Saprospiraceae bacterium]